jgi:hypothetical protein
MLQNIDTSKARIYWRNGDVEYFDDQAHAWQVYLWIALVCPVAFRGAGDTTPVYPHDYR